MKYIITLLIAAILATTVFACQVTEIQKNIYDAALTYQPLDFNVILDSTCPTQNIDIKIIDRVTNTSVFDIYNGPANSISYSFNWIPENTGAYQVFTNITSPTEAQQKIGTRILSTAPTNTENRNNITIYSAANGALDLLWVDKKSAPTKIEYTDFNITIGIINHTEKTFFNIPFSLSITNNDLNVISFQQWFFSSGGTIIKIINYPPQPSLITTIVPNDTNYYNWKIKKIKMNTKVQISVGSDQNAVLLTTDVNAKPNTKLNYFLSTIDNNTILLNQTVYNSNDVNSCTLWMNGINLETNQNVSEVNTIHIPFIGAQSYSIDINCITDLNHYLEFKGDPSKSAPHPELDNVPFSLEGGPISAYLPFMKGDGNINSPFEVTSCDQLPFINYYLNSNFVLKNDLNCSGVNYHPIGICTNIYRPDIADNAYRCIGSFKGVLDGNNHSITNLTSTGGLFNYISDTGIVKNLLVINANISGDSTGIIANNLMDGSIIDSVRISNSVLSGGYSAGCLVGSLESGHISNSRCTNSVISGLQSVGGIAGYMAGGHVLAGIPSIINSLSIDNNLNGTSSANDWQNVGGLVGFRARGDISNSHARTLFSIIYGTVGGLIGKSSNPTLDTITSSYWDVNTSGILISAGGEGKTTGEIQAIITNPPFN